MSAWQWTKMLRMATDSMRSNTLILMLMHPSCRSSSGSSRHAFASSHASQRCRVAMRMSFLQRAARSGDADEHHHPAAPVSEAEADEQSLLAAH